MGTAAGTGAVTALTAPTEVAGTRAATVSALVLLPSSSVLIRKLVLLTPAFSWFPLLGCSLAHLHLIAKMRSHVYTLVAKKPGMVSSSFTLRRQDS